MAKGLQQQDFSNPQVWELVQQNKYDKAFQNSQKQDLKPIIVNWLNKNAKTINIEDEQIVDLVTNWYLYFREITNNSRPEYYFTNPLFAYLVYLGKANIKPSYNDLVAVNNKYEERILDDVDFRNGDRCKVLENPKFYGRNLSSQNYWLDIYAFFSEPSNVKKALSGLDDYGRVTIGDENYAKNNLDNGTKFRDTLLFVKGDPKGNLRPPKDIEIALTELSKNLSREDQKTRKQYKDTTQLANFVNKNLDDLNNSSLRNDLLLWLSEG